MAKRNIKKFQIYLVEYLGIHSTTIHYLKSLKRILEEIPGVNVEILSNFSEDLGRNPFLFNQYVGNLWNKVIALYRNYRRLSKLIDEYPSAIYIFVTYGNQIDISYIRIISKARKHVIDVRCLFAPGESDTAEMLFKFAKTYTHFTSNVISHSSGTDEFLDEIDYIGNIFHLPSKLDNSCGENPLTRHDNERRENDIKTFKRKFHEWLELDSLISIEETVSDD